ncbi:FAD-dependent oxidoreductase [Patescibacteria group bacterium]|nr:FAD-dependent oxidoreductase [Patescibacteria group bacterium]
MKLYLLSKNNKFSDIIEFQFNPEKEISWTAGQFLQYYIDDDKADDRGNDRYFTIASSPFEKNIYLTTRINVEHGSSFKSKLYSMNIGDTIVAEGPFGQFVLNDQSQSNYIFIAGGIGITPFRSILLDLDYTNKLNDMNISLFYANRNEEFVYKDVFDALKSKCNKLNFIYTTSTIDKLFIEKNVDNINNYIFYLSGPEGFVKYIKELLTNDLNIDSSNIKLDYFPGYSDI